MSSIARVPIRSDAELVALALDRDQGAWNELVKRYTRLVWHVINGFRQLDHHRRADIHQTVWLRLAEKLDALRDPDRVGGWLATTARNECLRQLRHQTREVPGDEIEPDPIAEPVGLRLLEEARDRELWHAFEQLREECRQLLRLMIADPPFSYDEIAEILDMPRGSIGPTRQRCLDRLRNRLGANPQEGLS